MSFIPVVKEYVLILVYICLPVLLITTGLALWLHYRRKKRIIELEDAEKNNSQPQSSLSLITSKQTVALSPLAIEDKVGLIKECRRQLTKSRAKYMALKQDFCATQKAVVASENELQYKIGYMEKLNEKITAYEKQIRELQNKLEVLETAIPVKDEASFLREALREKDIEIVKLKERVTTLDISNFQKVKKEESVSVLSSDQNINTYIRKIELLQQEKAVTDRKLGEQESQKDVYAQSRVQIEYLQNQLEQRIKNHSEAEQKNKELNSSLQQVLARSTQLEGKVTFLNQQIESKHHELEQAQLILDQKDAEIHRMKEELQGKASQVSHLENLLAELKEQNSILNITFGESQNAISLLKEQLAGEQQHINQIEDRLLKNKQLLERIYRDLESSVINDLAEKQQALVKPMY